MAHSLVGEFKQLHILKKFLLLAIVVLFISYGLLHTGLIILPAAKARDCSLIKGKEIIVSTQNGKFVPAQVRAEVCDKLIFVNLDSQPRWPAVGPHPTHTSYPGFDSKRALKQGEQFEFLLNRPGHYSFHDHLQDDIVGSVTITQP